MSLFTDGCYQCAPAEALIAKVLAGRCTMHYTRVAVGNGSIPEGSTPATMTEPAGYVMDAKPVSYSHLDVYKRQLRHCRHKYPAQCQRHG